jgi:hypothetical protein
VEFCLPYNGRGEPLGRYPGAGLTAVLVIYEPDEEAPPGHDRECQSQEKARRGEEVMGHGGSSFCD